MKRRALLAGLVAAPAIVTAGNIMRINPKLALPPKGIYDSGWVSVNDGVFVLGDYCDGRKITGFDFAHGQDKTIVMEQRGLDWLFTDCTLVSVCQPNDMAQYMRPIFAD